MGAYLSEPVTTKESSDESNDFLVSGASSMQGWRISQEDAHNCILNFDKNVSFFAVYDGHGGAEVAQYCSLHLPSFLRTVAAYGEKNFEQALKDAFIGFDATLLKESVIQELKVLSEKTNGNEEAEEDDEEEDEYDNVDDLREEARMPLDEVLQKYRKEIKASNLVAAATATKSRLIQAMKDGDSSKPISPLLKGKRREVSSERDDELAGGSGAKVPGNAVDIGSAEAAPAATGSKIVDGGAGGGGDTAADSTVSSSSNNKTEEGLDGRAMAEQEPSSSSSSASGAATVAAKEEDQSDEISDTAGAVVATSATVKPEIASVSKENCAPDSSSSDRSKQQAVKVNGDIGKATASSAAAVSSSSSGAAGQENGVVSSDCDSGAGNGSKLAQTPSIANVHSSSTAKAASGSGASEAGNREVSKNGPCAAEAPNDDDDDTEEDDDSDSDVMEPIETSSTEDGEEEPYGEEDGDEEEEEEEGEEEAEYEEEEDYMNEEDAAFMKNITDEPGKDSGCTAVVALLHEKDLYVANAGDSRCVVCRNGKALEMSFDHKPEDTIEFKRIEKAGGRVTLDGRVNGGLNLSRAIGDHGYKMNGFLPPEEQMISALPDIQKITIGSEDDFMVLACDGIWNFMTSDEVVQFVQERINKPGIALSKICEELFDNCLAQDTKGDGTGCDNMTAIIVQFKPTFADSASRKRTAAQSVDASENIAVSSGLKKIKTDTATTAATASIGGSMAVETSEETEAAAAVVSIAATSMDTTPATIAAASSEAASSST
ncbi:probable protein phosphatase CG10417 isoform X2 [Anopheles bellator]|uniref:probable protein phosphatase CG10417 isoform X2 n=1 Tax=Anopheles bellator TaxID=139047 RepID=UPI002647725F|nr:probable protein phosphatase CG10417 isoform X2 [Anopheles bellator]